MAGGKGERFWPQSRFKKPKQLLPIVGDEPMLRQTLHRLKGIISPENIMIITHELQRPSVIKICPELNEDQIIGEPVGRNTAPTAALAAVLIKQKNPQATFALLPADQVIHDIAAFQKVLLSAFKIAEQEENLITVGINPTYAATGYGYIHRGSSLKTKSASSLYNVKRFVEKPDFETANKYYQSGDYYWNAGIFVWSVSAIKTALEQHCTSLWHDIQNIEYGLKSGGCIKKLIETIYSQIEPISIDYALMEKAKNVIVLESTFDWDDVGEWPAVVRHYPADAQGNTIRGKAIVHDGKNNLVINKEGHLTAVIGVEDLIIVQTPDATLVCPKSKAQDIKKIVQKLNDLPEGSIWL